VSAASDADHDNAPVETSMRNVPARAAASTSASSSPLRP
jgi:hypothetical protein